MTRAAQDGPGLGDPEGVAVDVADEVADDGAAVGDDGCGAVLVDATDGLGGGGVISTGVGSELGRPPQPARISTPMLTTSPAR